MTVQKKLTVVKTLAGEGNFHAYKLLAGGSRIFLLAKYLRTSLNYWRGRGQVLDSIPASIVYIKGFNQLRHYNETKSLIEARIRSVQAFYETNLGASSAQNLARISTIGLIHQVWFLFLMLASGRRRYLNLYYLRFYEDLRGALHSSALANVQNFLCFNDQPYDVAALVLMFREFGTCRTIVLQHGLILSPHFFFPTNTHEFWAWGPASSEHFRSRFPGTQLITTGRRLADAISKSAEFRAPPPGDAVSIVIAPSFYHKEIKALVRNIAQSGPNIDDARNKIIIKLHPSTKLKYIVRFWIWRTAPWIVEDISPMDKLAKLHGGLLTKNSSSSVDFLLHGKPVFFEAAGKAQKFPSEDYGFSTEDLRSYLKSGLLVTHDKNRSRLFFLREYLNV